MHLGFLFKPLFLSKVNLRCIWCNYEPNGITDCLCMRYLQSVSVWHHLYGGFSCITTKIYLTSNLMNNLFRLQQFKISLYQPTAVHYIASHYTRASTLLLLGPWGVIMNMCICDIVLAGVCWLCCWQVGLVGFPWDFLWPGASAAPCPLSALSPPLLSALIACCFTTHSQKNNRCILV